jgi:hypothetical protein
MNQNIILNINLFINDNQNIFKIDNYYYKLMLIKFFSDCFDINIKNFHKEYRY